MRDIFPKGDRRPVGQLLLQNAQLCRGRSTSDQESAHAHTLTHTQYGHTDTQQYSIWSLPSGDSERKQALFRPLSGELDRLTRLWLNIIISLISLLARVAGTLSNEAGRLKSRRQKTCNGLLLGLRGASSDPPGLAGVGRMRETTALEQ